MTRITLFRTKNAMLIANLISNVIGVAVVMFFSIASTPEGREAAHAVNRFFLPLAFLFPFIATLLYERPIRRYWAQKYKGSSSSSKVARWAQKRILNEPFFLIALDLAVWLSAAIIYAVNFLAFGYESHIAKMAFARNLFTGLITVTVAFFVFEFVLQRRVVTHIFPEGGLSLVPGTLRIRIRTRLIALLLACNLIPFSLVLLEIGWFHKSEDPVQTMNRLQTVIPGEALVFIGVGIWLTFLISSNLANSLHEMVSVLRKVRRGMFDQKVKVLSNDEVGYTADVINQMTEGLLERDFIKETFGKYVSSEIRDEILADRIPLDGELRRATVLFADLRDFTPMVEKTDPKEVIRILNGYFKEMDEAIRAHHGLVLQYIGDEIEAVFGAPIAMEDHSTFAVAAALEMEKRLRLFNERLASPNLQLAHGIGIHTGQVVAANIGSPDRLSYTLVGGSVNLASRVQALNKELGTQILITEETRQGLSRPFELKKFPLQRVKGMARELQVYAVA